MNYYSEKDIREIVTDMIVRSGLVRDGESGSVTRFPVETSARHVHLTRNAVERLFGAGYRLTKKTGAKSSGRISVPRNG